MGPALNDVIYFQLRHDGATYTVEINEQEERTLQYMGVGREVITRCKSPDRIATDDSLDGGYTISVKTEDEKQNRLKDTLRIIEPRHWTVDDRGVLVNADESEMVIKVEKPDGTIENVIADCSTIISGQDASETKDGIPTVKEEDAHVQRIER